MTPRKTPALDSLPASNVVRVAADGDLVAAIRSACNNRMSLSVEAKPGLCTELTEQFGRRLVHFVNYRSDGPVTNVAARVRLPGGRRAKGVTLVSPQRKVDRAVSFSQDGGVVRFKAPKVDVYEIAVVAME
jgi:hypothetical protein